LELVLKGNKEDATWAKMKDKIYLRLEKDFRDCGGLLGPSDFLDGNDEEGDADATEDDRTQASDEIAGAGGYANEMAATIETGPMLPGFAVA
jgi:hypothetical protein